MIFSEKMSPDFLSVNNSDSVEFNLKHINTFKENKRLPIIEENLNLKKYGKIIKYRNQESFVANSLRSKSVDLSPRPTSESGTSSSVVKDNLGFMRFFSMARKNEPRASIII